MKILFFLSAFPAPIDDGIKKIVDNIIRQSLKEGKDITLVVPESNLELDYQVRKIFYHKKRTIFSIMKDFLSLQPLYFSFYYDRTILKKINKEEYDLIFYDFFPMTQYSSGLKKELFMMPDSMKLLAWGTFKNSDSFLNKIYHFVNYLLVSIYNRRIENLKKLYVSKEDISIDGLQNSYFLKIPADEIDFSKYWDIEQDKNEISFRGVMSFEPNITAVKSFYEDIFIEIIKENLELKFKVIGKAPHHSLFKLTRNTELTGFVDDPLFEMAKSYIHIVPMVSGSGVKTKILDSMALKRLIFATPKAINGVFADCNEAQENGVVIYRNKDDFKMKLKQLYDEKINYREYTEKAYNYIRRNNYSKLIVKLEEIGEY